MLNINHTTFSGRFRTKVMNADGTTASAGKWQKNLILDSGLDLLALWNVSSILNYCVAGTGNTPTRDVPGGDTFSQTGTTVTRISGTDRDFIAGDVGKILRFSTGQEAYITAFIDVNNVTVDTSRTVAATTIILYRVKQTGLTTEVKRTNTKPVYNWEDGLPSIYGLVNGQSYLTASLSDWDKGICTYRTTFDFSAEVGSVNYTEIGLSPSVTVANNLFNRILLAGAVTVQATQLLRVEFELTVKRMEAEYGTQPTITSEIPGWPRPYTVSSAAASGSALTITVSESHHYLAAGNIRLSGITRPKVTITAASSTVSTLTITAVAHGRSPGDTVLIEGVTPSGYNGRWTVATTPTADTLTITSAVDPGPGTVFGTVRQQEPRGTVVTVGTSTSTALTLTAAGHGYSVGQLVVIKGMTPSGYNGVWLVESVSGNDFTVTTTANPGSATAFGDTYLATAGTWFDGSYTIASVTSTTIVITSAATHASGQYGTAKNNVRRKLIPLKTATCMTPYFGTSGNPYAMTQDNDGNLTVGNPQPNITDGWVGTGLAVIVGIPAAPSSVLPLGFPRRWRGGTGGTGTTASVGPTGVADAGVSGYGATTFVDGLYSSKPAYTAGTFTESRALTFAAGVANQQNIKYIMLGAGYIISSGGASDNTTTGQDCHAYLLFEEPQRKDSTHALTITVTKTWGRDLAASA